MSKTLNVKSAPAVAVQRVVRSIHPWKLQDSNAKKLKQAREARYGKRKPYKHLNASMKESVTIHGYS